MVSPNSAFVLSSLLSRKCSEITGLIYLHGLMIIPNLFCLIAPPQKHPISEKYRIGAVYYYHKYITITVFLWDKHFYAEHKRGIGNRKLKGLKYEVFLAILYGLDNIVWSLWVL